MTDNSTRPKERTGSSRPTVPVAIARGIGGAIVGAVLSYFIFDWMWNHGFYSAMVMGALLGLGFGLASGRQMKAAGFACAAVAIVFSFWTEWKVAPFEPDDGFIAFIEEVLTSGRPVKLLMHGLGAVAAFWFGQGR